MMEAETKKMKKVFVSFSCGAAISVVDHEHATL